MDPSQRVGQAGRAQQRGVAGVRVLSPLAAADAQLAARRALGASEARLEDGAVAARVAGAGSWLACPREAVAHTRLANPSGRRGDAVWHAPLITGPLLLHGAIIIVAWAGWRVVLPLRVDTEMLRHWAHFPGVGKERRARIAAAEL